MTTGRARRPATIRTSIRHLLSQVPYKPLDHRDITLPKRARAGGYVEPDLPLRYIPEPF